jgi:hypothetical protein
MKLPLHTLCCVLLLASAPAPCAAAQLRAANLLRGGRDSAHGTDSSASVTVTLNNYNNVQYSAPFTVGGQELPVIYDTGSFDIIVLSTLCSECAQIHSVYDRAKSSSFSSAGGVETEFYFGSGSVVSRKAFEDVILGRLHAGLSTPQAPFWQVVSHQIAVWNENAKFSGIVGLGPSDRIPEGYGAGSNPEKTLLAQLGVTRFAICLGRGAVSAPGFLTLWRAGAPVPGTFLSMPVMSDAHWGVRMTDVRLAGVSFKDPCVPSCQAIIDSGTSLIAVPKSASGLISAISAKINKDCSNMHDLPMLELSLGGHQVRLPPSVYVIKRWGGTECGHGFMVIEKTSFIGPVWVLGMPFLRYYHTIFDRSIQAKKIHIAPSNPSCSLDAVGLASNITAAAAVPVNSTVHTHLSSDTTASTRAFAEADFQPTEVDMTAIRAPSWDSHHLGSVGGAASARGSGIVASL